MDSTTGPVDVVSPRGGKPLAHTAEYLAAKEKRRQLIEERKKELQERIARDQQRARLADGEHDLKRRKVTESRLDLLVLQNLTNRILTTNKEWYKSIYGDRAVEAETFDAGRAEARKKEAEAKKAYFEDRARKEMERRELEKRIVGSFFKDDWDERY
jgi:chromatin structure-remodeling complex subunit RSC1/2